MNFLSNIMHRDQCVIISFGPDGLGVAGKLYKRSLHTLLLPRYDLFITTVEIEYLYPGTYRHRTVPTFADCHKHMFDEVSPESDDIVDKTVLNLH